MSFIPLGRTKNVANRSKKYLEEALYNKLLKDGSSEVAVRRQLNEFLKSRKRVYKWEIDDSIKKLRDRKIYYPALKLSEVMSHRGVNKTVNDQAIHLDLVAKARGIEAAESYFIELTEVSKNHLTYGALLNCYCKELMTEKAEALVEKMKELKIGMSSMPYNSLMTLYTKIGQPEKVPAIVQEMKASDVMFDVYSYNVWMRALAAVDDISGVERVIDEMKRDGRVTADWTTYSNLASIYVDAGLVQKAENALKELESRHDRKDITAFQFLITLYGRIGKLHEVYRVWRSLRLAFKKTANISYLNMVQALVQLDDIPGAEKCFREWESCCLTYDIRVANALMKAYTSGGEFKKAEELKERVVKSGAKLNSKTWEIFMDYHVKVGEMKTAVDCVCNGISAGKADGRKWLPSSDAVSTLMKHFEQEKDVDGAESFLEILKKGTDSLGVEVFESLIRTYAAAERTSPMLRRRLKMEKVDVSENIKKLLDVVCIE
ncbi:unnamed protein product [Rhodiola kirilowii]